MKFLLVVGGSAAAGFAWWAIKSLWCKVTGREKPSVVANILGAFWVVWILTAVLTGWFGN